VRDILAHTDNAMAASVMTVDLAEHGATFVVLAPEQGLDVM
jgi:hypothetical protein